MQKNYVIAVFKTRTQTYEFYELLRKNKIKAFIVDTPKQNKISCGISVKFLRDDFNKVSKFITSFRSGFVNFIH